MRVTDGDVTKLPQWAQRRIEKLEADVEYWRRKVTEAVSGDTDTFLGDWPDNIGLPRGSRIVFHLPEKAKIDVRVKDSHLYVMGSDSLEVQPQTGNTLKMKVGRWW